MDKTTERILMYGTLAISIVLVLVAVKIKERYDTEWKYNEKIQRKALKLTACAELASLIFLIGVIVMMLYTIIKFGVLGWITVGK